MDKSAIEQIQQAQTAKGLNDVLSAEGLNAAVIAAPESFKILSLERHLPYRLRFRGQYNTDNLKGFIAYTAQGVEKSTDNGPAKVFVNGQAMCARAVLNIGSDESPGHCDHTATLTLPQSAAYKALLNYADNPLNQLQLSNFIEDWGDIMGITDVSGEVISPAVAASEARSVTIERAREINSSVGDFENSASAFERVGAKNKATLPAWINFTCTPYLGLQERTFKVRVSLLTGDDKPRFKLRIVGLEQMQEQLTDEFQAVLNKALKSANCELFAGEFSA